LWEIIKHLFKNFFEVDVKILFLFKQKIKFKKFEICLKYYEDFMKKFLILSFFVLLVVVFHMTSRPQYSILQSFGTDCSGCHFNTQGGGVRTPGGWMSRNAISTLPGDWMTDIFTTNAWFDDKLYVGMDTRLQWAKWPAPGQGEDVPIGTTEYNFMAMQVTPYLVVQPFEWLAFEGQYNIAYDLYEDKRYIGQNPFAASMVLMPGDGLPKLRVGYFQPPMSMKWDDHTLLSHQFYGARGRRPVIPDDYAELGGQIDYEHYFSDLGSLSLSAGGFSSNNMAQFANTVDSNTISMVGRFMISPQIDWDFTTFLTGNGFINGDYYIASLSLGWGLADNYSLILEYSDMEKKDIQRAITLLGEFTYQITESILPFVRAERQLTRESNQPAANYTNQVVLGAHINILPYFDLLPEYRIVDREWIDGYHSQFAFQIHIWY